MIYNFYNCRQKKFSLIAIFFSGTNRNWIHPPDALQKGHIAYLVKVCPVTAFRACERLVRGLLDGLGVPSVRKLSLIPDLPR